MMTDEEIYQEEPKFEEGEFGQPLCPECGSSALYASVMTRCTGVCMSFDAEGTLCFDTFDAEVTEEEITQVYCSDCQWRYSYEEYGEVIDDE